MINIRRPVVRRQRVDNTIVLLIPRESADESKPIYPANGHPGSRLIWRRASAKSAALRHGEPVHVGGRASTVHIRGGLSARAEPGGTWSRNGPARAGSAPL